MDLAFGERLKELRQERKLTQKQLAAIIYVKQTTISDWEVCRSEPSLQTLVALAKFFDVSVGYLLGVED